jgi:hypothetical protein
MNHKTQKQNLFYKVQGILFGDSEDYHFLGFHVVCSGRSALLKDVLPPSSGQEMIFPKPQKVVKSSG